jgi:oligosaccharide repeat unit polymerase
MAELALPVALLAVLAVAARAVQGSWAVPGPFFAAVWVAFLFLALLFVADFPLRVGGLWAIVALATATVVGSWIADAAIGPASAAHGAGGDAVPERLRRNILAVVVLFSAVSSLGVVVLYFVGLEQFGLPRSFRTLLSLGSQFASARYGLRWEPPWSVRVFLYWVNPAALLGGMAFVLARTHLQRLVAFLPFVIALASGTLVAARSGMLIAVALWCSGLLTMWVVTTAGRVRLHARTVLLMAAAVVALFAAATVLQWVRHGSRADADISSLIFEGQFTVFSSISVFTTWYEADGPAHVLGWGAGTVAGVYDLLGVAARAFGFYELPVSFESGYTSNIYTLFRGLLDDFGWGGAILVCAGSGAVATIAYRRLAATRFGWALVLSLFYAMTLFSSIVSLIGFTSVLAAWPIVGLLWMVHRMTEPRPVPARASLAMTAS